MNEGDRITVWILMHAKEDLWRPFVFYTLKEAMEFIHYKAQGRFFQLQTDLDTTLEKLNWHAEAILDGATKSEEVDQPPTSAS